MVPVEASISTALGEEMEDEREASFFPSAVSLACVSCCLAGSVCVGLSGEPVGLSAESSVEKASRCRLIRIDKKDCMA